MALKSKLHNLWHIISLEWSNSVGRKISRRGGATKKTENSTIKPLPSGGQRKKDQKNTVKIALLSL